MFRHKKKEIIDSIFTKGIEEILDKFLKSPGNKENIYDIVVDINARMQEIDTSKKECNIILLRNTINSLNDIPTRNYYTNIFINIHKKIIPYIINKLNQYIINKLKDIEEDIKKNEKDIEEDINSENKIIRDKFNQIKTELNKDDTISNISKMTEIILGFGNYMRGNNKEINKNERELFNEYLDQNKQIKDTYEKILNY